jgi:FeS assembly SUF system regulator
VIRMAKLTDYGLVVMTHMAHSQDALQHRARELAVETRLPLPTVSKLLKQLMLGGLLVSQRGVNGGYSLARKPQDISVAEIIAALEGPIALTECSTEVSGLCDLEPCCAIKKNQQIINQAVRSVLENVMLSDLAGPLHFVTQGARRNLVSVTGVIARRMQ